MVGSAWPAASTKVVLSRARARVSSCHWSTLPGPAAQDAATQITCGALLGQPGVEAREADVVAGGQPDRDAGDVDDHRLVAGGHGVGLGEAEGVEQVDLVVVRRHRPARRRAACCAPGRPSAGVNMPGDHGHLVASAPPRSAGWPTARRRGSATWRRPGPNRRIVASGKTTSRAPAVGGLGRPAASTWSRLATGSSPDTIWASATRRVAHRTIIVQTRTSAARTPVSRSWAPPDSRSASPSASRPTASTSTAPVGDEHVQSARRPAAAG